MTHVTTLAKEIHARPMQFTKDTLNELLRHFAASYMPDKAAETAVSAEQAEPAQPTQGAVAEKDT
ncbi:hypothetical protein N7453_009037 [Penicillium expansum]|nr:hypothetical protein N7453_009037 [Penicillium expansum]